MPGTGFSTFPVRPPKDLTDFVDANETLRVISTTCNMHP